MSRTRVHGIRYTDDEWLAIEKAAGRAEISPTEFVRKGSVSLATTNGGPELVVAPLTLAPGVTRGPSRSDNRPTTSGNARTRVSEPVTTDAEGRVLVGVGKPELIVPLEKLRASREEAARSTARTGKRHAPSCKCGICIPVKVK